jgi:hypothetical protein
VNGWIYNYQTLMTGLLALGGAYIVLVAAKWQIAHERDLAKQAKEDRVIAARMRVAYQLELLANDLVAIVRRRKIIQGFVAAEGDFIPLPDYVANMADLTQLPSAESEAMLDLARRISVANSFLTRSSAEDAERFRYLAAINARTAIDWRNRLGTEVGWREMPLGKRRRGEMQTIINAHKSKEADET